ncbi:DNA helicase [Pararhizobium polonicum]|uniref:DNA helicase n=1 Tax=Pararhizobium polonicum TaxID=1612624 RepID=A0A1C7NVB3_9HYPH|nr:DNA helicase [Pararhizobium polonicum]OBZ92951.1 DNA helicase [Pararhizobium polonicum]
MPLSAPVYHLKRQAKLLSRNEKIPLHAALDRIALKEGFSRWSLLLAKRPATAPAGEFFGRLTPGDLVLIGARPGHGKTLMSLELAVEAMKSGNRSVFFTLEYTEKDILDRFRALGVDVAHFNGLFGFDTSDAISAGYIAQTMAAAPPGTLVIIDYLQLLDQKRDNPELMVQIRALKAFAREKGLIIVFISQIDRSYDSSEKPFPGIDDIRLPNPLDLTLFDRTCFLNRGEVQFRDVR